MADHTPTDETVLRQPAAPVSAQEIAEMRRLFSRAAGSDPHGEFVTMGIELGGHVPRLLDAIEALTAENARLKAVEDLFNGGVRFNPASFRQEVMGWVEAEKDKAGKAAAERDALKAELTELRLQCLSHEGQAHAAYEAQERAEGGRQVLREACVAFLGQIAYVEADGAYYVTTDQADALEAAVRATPNAPATTDHGWYFAQRRRVEADHAAAKDDEAEGLRPMTADEIASHSYLLTRATEGN